MEFTAPSFCEGYDTEEVLERMLENLPDDIDVSEGGHPFNLEAPPAYEISYLMEFILPEAIKLIWPMFCEDYPEIMEWHAQTRRMKRKEAHYATGELLINGEPNVEIPKGSIFSTISVNDEASIEFQTTEDAIIGVDGTVTVSIQAVLGGTTGNVPAGTILIADNSIDDLTSVTNPKETTGGLEEESTEELQSRIMEHDATIDTSYGGSPADYKRWALEVSGTGSAIVISPPDDSTPIQIILTDAAGNPASEELCQEVWNHIMRPDDEDARLAPTNDQLAVIPPSTLEMSITVTVELTQGFTLETVKTTLLDALRAYIPQAADAGEVRYSKVGSIISTASGIEDYKDLLINGGTANVPIADTNIPNITDGGVVLTEGTV